MEIQVKETGLVTVVSLNGEVDREGASQVQERISPLIKGKRFLILDLAGVTSLSSAGLRFLLSLRRQLPAGSRLILTGLSDQLKDSMEIAGFLGTFEVKETVEQARSLI